MIYTAGCADDVIGEAHLHLETSGVEQIVRFFWNSVFETPGKLRLIIERETKKTPENLRLMVDLLHRAKSFRHKDGSRLIKGAV